MRWIVELLRDGGVPVRKFVATGGLPHHNPLVVQVYADVLGEPIAVHPSRQGPALGSAILGALAAGEAVFADAGGALEATLASFRYRRIPLLDQLRRRIDRVLVLATKADHVTTTQYLNLRQLVAGRFSGTRWADAIDEDMLRFDVVAAVRATQDGWMRRDGVPTPSGMSAAAAAVEDEALWKLYRDLMPVEASEMANQRVYPVREVLPPDTVADLLRLRRDAFSGGLSEPAHRRHVPRAL